jgi:hypothetical protein
VRNAYFVTSCLVNACADPRNMWLMRDKWRDVLVVKKKIAVARLMKKFGVERNSASHAISGEMLSCG